MTSLLPFAESVVCWELACSPSSRPESSPHWPGRVFKTLPRLVVSLIFAWASGWNGASFWVAGMILAGSIALPAVRQRWVPTRFLAEFEVVWHGLAAFAFWQIWLHAPGPIAGLQLMDGVTETRQAAVCIAFALFLFAIRGGSFVVIGVLGKAPGVTGPATSGEKPARSPAEIIGYIERAIVMLIVAAGNLQALAFFFVAKGLARSKKLEEDPAWANYFLLGSLASFFVALVCGLIAQQAIALFWK